MATNGRTEMRIPTRAAPSPPVSSVMQQNPWNSSNDLFGPSLTTQTSQKKKLPPPRPPPPKFNQNSMQNKKDTKPKKPARPTELLTNFFGRNKTGKVTQIKSYQSHKWNPPLTSMNQTSQVSSNVSNNTAALIDLSPPESPTLTTRSSSDGVSIDSFGSDGNSNPSLFTSSGNTSQAESGFEDDFDFYTSANAKIAEAEGWHSCDPFGPIEQTPVNTYAPIRNSNQTKFVGESSFFTFNSQNFASSVSNTVSKLSNVVTSKPTIIRARPSKSSLTQRMDRLEQENDMFEIFRELELEDSSNKKNEMSDQLDLYTGWGSDEKNHSPPMPTFPPPAPPSAFASFGPTSNMENNTEPYGIVLYNFPAGQPGDLPLKQGDIVKLKKIINDDWLEGSVGNKHGMFPANFIDIKIPLEGLKENIVTALYAFKGETMEDLTFEEGAKITVLSRISNDWLYGEYNGRKGIFPANYVNRIPRDH